jgi:2,4-dienoyl-CoA reductase-like NADH-dependent reductase (Old Yellow Enzyme family)/thioredoxin reductase
MRYPYLFSPIDLNGVGIKNRIVFTSVGIDCFKEDGTVPDEYISFVRTRTCDTGLIITTVSSATYRYGGLKFYGSYHDRFIPSLSKIAKAAHEGGTKVFLQIFAMGGPNTLADDVFREVVPYVPSANVPMYLEWNGNNTPRELKKYQIAEIRDDFIQAAWRAKEAGFDGVELFAAEDFLLSSFLCPYLNRRTDMYGGSLENMVRLPVEIIRGIKKLCGEDFGIGFKYNAYYEFPEGGGVNLKLGAKIGLLVAREGVSYLHAYAYAKHTIPFSLFRYTIMPGPYQPRNTVVSVAEYLKQRIEDTPIMTVGGIMKPCDAEHIIQEEKADLVSIGRAFIADPLWAYKSKRDLRIRPCIRCYYCLHEATNSRLIQCTVNPDVLGLKKEVLSRAPKNIIVVGGGPAGITVAITLSRRGHQVTLFEKESEIGGMLIPGSMPRVKYEFEDLLSYFQDEVSDSQIHLKKGCEVTVDMLREIQPDVLVVAIGAKPIIPEIPGIGKDCIMDVVSALRSAESIRGSNVVVIGGGSVGCETSLVFRRLENRVTVIEQNERLMSEDPIEYNTMVLERMMRQEGVLIMTGATVKEIQDRCVLVEDSKCRVERLPAEKVVYSVGFAPLSEEAHLLSSTCTNSYIIGDCVESRKLWNAIAEGFEVGNCIS